MKEITASTNPNKVKKYVIDGEFFFIYPSYYDAGYCPGGHGQVLKEHITHKDKIISYSNGDNKIVEVHEITDQYIKTKYYADWYPLMITNLCKTFYSESEIRERATEFKKLLVDYAKLSKLYKHIKKEYENFENATALVFTDKTSNNILTNRDFSDFRIIDIGSIVHKSMISDDRPREFPDARFSPQRLMANHPDVLDLYPEDLGYDKEMRFLIKAVPWPKIAVGNLNEE